MRSFIENIILLCKDDTVRNVAMKKGVNIITGDSKTGKSALAEIIDYCLCSKYSSVPKGVIVDNVSVYALKINIACHSYLIARKSPNLQMGGKMYFIQVDDDFNIKQISLSYFSDKTELAAKEAQGMIESVLRLSVTDLPLNEEKSGKASLRNMMSYLLQHQNIIANKYVLFYRFDDFNKRKQSVDQFPVFAGIANQDYYSSLTELDELRKKRKTILKAIDNNRSALEFARQKLGPLIRNYFNCLGATLPDSFDDHNATTLLQIAKALPSFEDEDVFGHSDIIEQKKENKKELASLNEKLMALSDKLALYFEIKNDANGYSGNLSNLRADIASLKKTSDICDCPLCGQKYDGVQRENHQIERARHWLESELKITERYLTNYDEDTAKINQEIINTKREIEDRKLRIKEIDAIIYSNEQKKSLVTTVRELKAQIEFFVEASEKGVFDSKSDDLAGIENQIRTIEERIGQHNVASEMRKAESFINSQMNRLAYGLDFEEEYKPYQLAFGLVDGTFGLSANIGSDTVSLGEMGSGANWLSCHVSLFLSLLRYFASRKDCPMLLTMFFDQPSQIYYSEGKEPVSNEDRKAISRIYKTIISEIDSIMDEYDTDVQLIITDHIVEIEDDDDGVFASNIIVRWRNGAKLI